MERVKRLKWRLAPELEQAGRECARTGQPARVFQELRWRTLDGWSRERRVMSVRIRVSVRTVRLSFDEGYPGAGLFRQVLARLQKLPPFRSSSQAPPGFAGTTAPTEWVSWPNKR